MEKSNNNGHSTQGAEDQLDAVEYPKIKEYLKKDLNICLVLLNEMLKDDAIISAVATVMHGRIINHRNKVKNGEFSESFKK